MAKPRLCITEWRELGDDEDCLDMRMVASKDYELFQAIATEHEVEFDAEKDLTDFTVIEERVIDHGDKFTDETGQEWIVRFEKAKD